MTKIDIGHFHDWSRTDETRRSPNPARKWTCECGEEAWSERPAGPHYNGPFGWTERELEAIQLVLIEGYTLKQAGTAMMLGGRQKGVATFLNNAKRKAGVKDIGDIIDIYRVAYPDVEIREQ